MATHEAPTTTTVRRPRTSSSRVDSRVLGMFLFIASEVMLFGSFFTAYFFVRLINGIPGGRPGPLGRCSSPCVNTCILVTSSFTVHWALQSIKRDNRAGMKAGLVLTLALGFAFLLTQASSIRASASRRATGRSLDDLLRPDGPPRGARLRRLCCLRGGDDQSVPRALFRGAPPRCRDPGDLLALRRRNVDRGVHDVYLLWPGTMANPFRSEAEAFRFLIRTIAAFAVIASPRRYVVRGGARS